MDPANEYLGSWTFLLIGLGFFLACMYFVLQWTNNDRDNRHDRQDIDYDRMWREAETYGYEGSRLQEYNRKSKK